VVVTMLKQSKSNYRECNDEMVVVVVMVVMVIVGLWYSQYRTVHA
jgi:hypothetical protein